MQHHKPKCTFSEVGFILTVFDLAFVLLEVQTLMVWKVLVFSVRATYIDGLQSVYQLAHASGEGSYGHCLLLDVATYCYYQMLLFCQHIYRVLYGPSRPLDALVQYILQYDVVVYLAQQRVYRLLQIPKF